jgi:hypothetical protein
MELPVITASVATSVQVPVTVSSQTITYDRWWQADMSINSHNPNGVVNAVAMMVKGRKLEDGTWELSKDDNDVAYISINDIFNLAETDAEVAHAIGAVLALVVRIGVEQGKL